VCGLAEYNETNFVLIFDQLYKTMTRRWYKVGRVYLSSVLIKTAITLKWYTEYTDLANELSFRSVKIKRHLDRLTRILS